LLLVLQAKLLLLLLLVIVLSHIILLLLVLQALAASYKCISHSFQEALRATLHPCCCFW
jgi:hypothetical protein